MEAIEKANNIEECEKTFMDEIVKWLGKNYERTVKELMEETAIRIGRIFWDKI